MRKIQSKLMFSAYLYLLSSQLSFMPNFIGKNNLKVTIGARMNRSTTAKAVN